MKFPDELHYSIEHIWVKIDKDQVVLGITDFAQSELGEIVYVDLPNIGHHFDKDQVFGSIEALKTVSDLFMPASGKVIDVNSKLVQDPKLVNSNPYDEGWLVKIKMTQSDELSQLLSAEEYSKDLGI